MSKTSPVKHPLRHGEPASRNPEEETTKDAEIWRSLLLFTGGETGRATGTPNRGRVAVIFYPAFTAKAGRQSKPPHRPEDSGKTSNLAVRGAIRTCHERGRHSTF